MSDVVLLSDDSLDVAKACSFVTSPSAGAVSMFIGILFVYFASISTSTLYQYI